MRTVAKFFGKERSDLVARNPVFVFRAPRGRAGGIWRFAPKDILDGHFTCPFQSAFGGKAVNF